MAGESAALLRLAESIADGSPIDWEAEEIRATAEERAVIRQLRVLAGVAVLHRSLPAHPEDWQPGGSAVQPPAIPAIGNWGHLVLLERLGSGSSGEVFRAWDRHLEREVALKLLRAPHTSNDPLLSRITQEGRLLARVRHPNVITVYGVGVYDGLAGLWMEIVRGATLEQTVAARGPFSAREAAIIGVDLCRALAAIHGAGLIHRDVKAQNVVREEGGRTVLMDLGTGRTTAPADIAAAGDLAGTPLYLAPEIFDGAPASARTDVYSTGVLLYRLVTGAFPVRVSSVEELHAAHASGRTVRLRDARADLPTAFVSVVDRAIDHNPDRRYATAGALEADLVRALDAPARPQGAGWERIAALAAAVIVVAGLAALASPWFRARFAPAPGPVRSIAVLPLVNLGDPSQEYFADGMTDELIGTLGRSMALDVISRTSVMPFKGTSQRVPEIARTLGVDAILEGSVLIVPAAAGQPDTRPRVRINARLVAAGTDTHLWDRTFEAVVDDVLALQADVATAVASGIRGRIQSGRVPETRHMTNGAPQDFTTFDLYLRGRYHWNMRTEEGMKRSLQYFQEAIDRDPQFARGHAGIADAYSLLGWYEMIPRVEATGRAIAAAERALQLDGSLGEAYASLALAQMARLQWDDAAASFTRAIELRPNYASAHHWYSAYLTQAGRLPEALSEIQRAVSLDPLSVSVNSQYGAILFMARRYDEAISQLEKTLRLNPGVARAQVVLADSYALKGDYERATAAIDKAVALGRGDLELRAHVGYIHALAGRRTQALEILKELEAAHNRQEPRAAGGAAVVYAGLGDTENAIQWLERARERRDPWLAYLKVHPQWDKLRGDPRFERLLAATSLAR